MFVKFIHIFFLTLTSIPIMGQVQSDSAFYKEPFFGELTYDSLKTDSIISSVVIRDIQIGRVSYIDLRDITPDGRLIKQVDLNYYENNFSIFCATQGFNKGDSLMFVWQLEGHNKSSWAGSGKPYRFGGDGGDMLTNGQQIREIVTYRNLSPGRYVFRARVMKLHGKWKKNGAELVINIVAPFWRTWWFWLSFVSGIGVIGTLLLTWRVRVVKKKEKDRFDYEMKILELEAKALRAQMNPHFTFNCLNSIKSLIQQHEEEKAVTYLTTFSKLIRTLFNNADKKEISLYDEVETCKLYLQLEAMRFDTKFSFAVEIDNTIDLKSIQVPALIIQPFLENAIWHGIIPRKAGGHISFTVFKKEDSVEITIDDDGIGRAASQRNRSASDIAHQSKGVNLTQSRLELNNLLLQRQATIETIDKTDAAGNAAGTKVIIKINEEL